MKKKAAKRLKAIIIGSADVIKLCVIRAVGTYGCDVDVIHLSSLKARGINPVDYYSKYVNNYYFTQRDGLIKLLLNKCKHPNIKPILFTLDDYSAFLIDESREILGNHFQFAHLLNNQPLGVFMNKHLLKMKASKAGMKVVEGWPILYENGDYILPEGIKYPCFLKGLNSIYVSKGVQCRCGNEKELLQYLDTCKRKYPHPLYAEEFIPIEKDFGVIGVSDGNNSIIPAKAELQVMGRGSTNGVSILGKLSPIEKGSVLFKQIESLLADLHYVGIFNIDFVESKGSIYFVELNFRFAAYGYSLFRAGVNLPALFINTVSFENLDSGNLRTTIDKDYYYLNEKIGIINVLEKSITWAKYKELKEKANYPMVKSDADVKPYRMFVLTMGMKFIKNIFRRIMISVIPK